MRKQQQIWNEEHASQATLPSMADAEPSSAVLRFADWLKTRNITSPARIIDIGCGKGRNSVYMAGFGHEIYAVDYIESALNVARELAENRSVSDKIHFELAELDRQWKYDDNFFDIAIDSFSSIDIETKEGRETYRDEMFRTLKSGGYALIAVVSADDEWEKESIAASPGPEPNSTIWQQNGKYQKDYTVAELREFYKDFEIVELQTVSKPAFKLGRSGVSTNFWVVLRKS